MGRSTRRQVVVVAAALGLLLAACGDDGSEDADSEDAATTTTDAAASTTDPQGTSSTPDGGAYGEGAPPEASVSVTDHEELGDILVGPDGRTLYLFTRDKGTTTACTGTCADNWPPLVAADPTAGEGVDEGELGTAQGIEADQVTYHGHLLYYFAGDDGPGDANGVGIPDWFAVDPDGEAVDAG